MRRERYRPMCISCVRQIVDSQSPERGMASLRRRGRAGSDAAQPLGRVRLLQRQRLAGAERLCEGRRRALVELGEDEVDAAVEALGQPAGPRTGLRAVIVR